MQRCYAKSIPYYKQMQSEMSDGLKTTKNQQAATVQKGFPLQK
jgi:hypothetical protein